MTESYVFAVWQQRRINASITHATPSRIRAITRAYLARERHYRFVDERMTSPFGHCVASGGFNYRAAPFGTVTVSRGRGRQFVLTIGKFPSYGLIHEPE